MNRATDHLRGVAIACEGIVDRREALHSGQPREPPAKPTDRLPGVTLRHAARRHVLCYVTVRFPPFASETSRNPSTRARFDPLSFARVAALKRMGTVVRRPAASRCFELTP